MYTLWVDRYVIEIGANETWSSWARLLKGRSLYKTTRLTHFVCWCFRPSQEFVTRTGASSLLPKGCNVKLKANEYWTFFKVPHRTSVYKVNISEYLLHSNLLPTFGSETISTCFNALGLSLAGFLPRTSCMQSNCSKIS